LKKLDSVLTSQVKADVAILMDWNNWWALELDSKPSSDLKLVSQLYHYYKPLFDHNITVDFAHPESDLSCYKLVIAPNLYLVSDASAKNITSYVENGGNLLMSFFSGIVDENEHIRLDGYPAPFREMLGLTVEEFAPYPETQTNSIHTTDGKQFQCTFWGDVILTKNTKAIATFQNDYYAGNAAVTQNRFGKGNAFYVGTLPNSDGMDWLLERACKTAGIRSMNLPAGVELLQRTYGKSTWLFVLNYSGKEVKVPLDGSGIDLLSGAQFDKSIRLSPMDVAIIQMSV
jgi:beta-galactosidase